MIHSTKTREKLVATAFELFHKQGFSATGVAQILRTAEVNSGSLYHYFPTKEDLLIAVLGMVQSQSVARSDPAGFRSRFRSD